VKRIGLVLALVALAAACSSSSGRASSTTKVSAENWTAPRSATHCNSYAIYATVGATTLPLATCAGLGGSHTLGHVALRRGQHVTLSFQFGSPRLTANPASVLAIDGPRIVAQRAGVAAVAAHDTLCVPLPNGVQPRSCRVVVVTVV
jgi:hypothetical protein